MSDAKTNIKPVSGTNAQKADMKLVLAVQEFTGRDCANANTKTALLATDAVIRAVPQSQTERHALVLWRIAAHGLALQNGKEAQLARILKLADGNRTLRPHARDVRAAENVPTASELKSALDFTAGLCDALPLLKDEVKRPTSARSPVPEGRGAAPSRLTPVQKALRKRNLQILNR